MSSSLAIWLQAATVSPNSLSEPSSTSSAICKAASPSEVTSRSNAPESGEGARSSSSKTTLPPDIERNRSTTAPAISRGNHPPDLGRRAASAIAVRLITRSVPVSNRAKSAARSSPR